jgi:cysteine desulfuration protein SufE
MPLSINQQHLREQFAAMRSWEDKYRFILRLGKTLPPMDSSLQTDDALLNGCESKVWFHANTDGDKLVLMVYSDAKIVRGLISIICESFKDLTLTQVKSFDCIEFLEELGLLSHLSPSRGNGIRAIVEQIKQLG